MSLVVFNAGSTSFKFAVFGLEPAPVEIARGSVAPVGTDAVLKLRHGTSELVRRLPIRDMRHAVQESLALLSTAVLRHSPATVLAHRIVYGDPALGEIQAVDGRLLERIRGGSFLAPLHQQAEIDVIDAAAEVLGRELPAYAAFDTGFYRDLPPAARTYAIPAGLSARLGIRRSGFHGFAHRSMLEAYCAASGQPASGARIISFQLGGGCSATAIRSGQPVETSMGYTPLEGLVMDTRCGDLDAGVVFECLHNGIPAQELYDTLERGSGLLGLSGVSSDLRVLLAEAARGSEPARLAIEVYCHRVRKYLGAYLAVLGGADAVVFGGGVGENQPEIRERICAGMQWCGLELDQAANRRQQAGTRLVSARQSRVAVYVGAVNEESVIARQTLRQLRRGA